MPKRYLQVSCYIYYSDPGIENLGARIFLSYKYSKSGGVKPLFSSKVPCFLIIYFEYKFFQYLYK
jgi:hypothetical protein